MRACEVLITKEFTFEAAHELPWHGGKCRNLHGHSYTLYVTVKGLLNENGVVIDFADLKELVRREVILLLDHQYLNDLIENPTAERIAQWIWDHVEGYLEGCHLYSIKLWETATSYVEVRKED